jgi:hypothetical protein
MSYVERSQGTAVSGYIGELAIWNRALNAKERRQVLEYLSAKWGPLPANPPNETTPTV